MEFFKSLHAFQRKASISNLNPTDRLVYLNLLIRSDLVGSDTFDMTADELTLFTGLHYHTVHESKRRMKNLGLLDFKRQHITLAVLDTEKCDFDVQKKPPCTPKKNKIAYNKLPSHSAGDARVKNSVEPGTLIIGKKPEWY